MKHMFLILVFLVLYVEADDDGFVKTRGVQLMLNETPYYANGFNAYWLMYIASDPSQRNKVTSTFQEAVNHGLNIARTWAFSDGGYKPLQYSPGSYNEEMFQGLDFVMGEARKYGMKVILSLVNNYESFGGKKQYVEWAKSEGQSINSEDDFFTNDVVKGYYKNHIKGLDFVMGEARKYGMKVILSLVNNYESFGGKKQYVEWAKREGQSINSEDDFFTNDVVKGYYKNHIKTVLTRHNNFTGVAYKDDPTIMAWELMNEIRCSSDHSGNSVQGWISEMSSYLKFIDGNHLLEAGLEGFYGQSKTESNPNFQVGTDFIANNQISNIDFATLHSYPDQWLSSSGYEDQLSFLSEWLNEHIQDAQNILHKPLLFAEFGISTKNLGNNSSTLRDKFFNTVYSAVYSSASGGGTAVGGLFWQLLAQGMDSFRDDYEVILAESPSTSTLISQESRKLRRIRKMYAKLHKH